MPETLEQRLARLRSGTAAPVAPDGLEARLNVLRAQAVATPHTEDDLPPDATLSPRALEGTRDLMDLEPPSASQSLAPSPTLFAPKDETFSSADVRHSLNTPAPEPFNLGGSPVAPVKRPPPIAKGPGPTHPSDVVADLVHPLPDGTVVTPRQPSEREQQMASYRIPAVRPDATEPAAPTGTNQDILAGRVSQDVAPINAATADEINRPTTTLGKVANTAGSMAAHPVSTAIGIATALPEAGLTLGKFAAQEDRKDRGDWHGEDVVSPKEAAFAAGQLLASGATEAALPIIDAFFGKQALNGVKAALENGEPPAVAVAKGYAARVAVHAAAGGAIGASFAPDDPTTGALLGAMIGGIHAAASSQKVGIVSKLGPTATMERPLAPDAAAAPDYSVAVDRGRQLLPENPIHDERPSVESPVSPVSWQDRAAATLFDKRYPPGVGNGQGAPITPEEGEQLRQSVAAAQATRLTAPPNPDALAPDALPDVTAIADATKLVGPYEWLSQIQQRIGRGDEISARSLGDLARSILATHAASQPDLEPATIPSHEEARASSAVDQGSVIPDVAQGSGGVSLPTRASRAVEAQAPAGPALAELPQLQGVVGHDSNVLLSDGRRIKTQYAVVEGDQIHPSHDPESFENNPSYPAQVQGREYKGPRGEQARQRVMTGALDTDVVLDRGGGLTDGPPLITPHGIVTAGNDRSMRILRAYRLNPDDAQRYRDELTSRAAEYGTSPGDIQAMHRPVLVRVINDPSVNVNSPETLQNINRVSDQTPTKTKDQYSDALSRAKAMQQATASMQHLSETMDPEGSINEYLSGAHGVDFVRKLVEDGVITKQELPSFITRTARAVSVNHEGRQRITDMLNAAAVGDADILAQTPPETIKKIQTSIPAIIAASHAGDYALGPTLRGALSVFAEAAAKRGELADKGFKTKKASIEAILSQGEMFDQFSPDVAGLARMLEAMPQKDIADAMREYARLAQSRSTASQSHDMFGVTPETPEELRARIFARPENTVQEHGSEYPGDGKRRREHLLALARDLENQTGDFSNYPVSDQVRRDATRLIDEPASAADIFKRYARYEQQGLVQGGPRQARTASFDKRVIAKVARGLVGLEAEGVSEIPNPYELFELAQKNPTGPEAKQLAAQDAVIAFGSEEAKQAVAKQLAPHLAQLKARGIPTASERQSFVDRMRLREPRIDLTGADVSTPAKLRAALSVMRHPLGESLSIFFKGDESGYEAGRALDHFVYSSGVLNMVAFDMKALAKEIVARAKELGVTTIAAGHNHPSGDPSFSDADHGWSLHLGRLLQEDGVHLEGHMTTDHDVGEWATPHPDMAATKKMHVDRVEIPGVDSKEWQTAVERGDEELNAANVGRLTRDVVDPKGVTAIYRDAGGRIIAVESRPFGERPADLLAHTDTQRGRLAARDVILATPYPDGLRAEALSQRRAGLSSGHYVTDILQVTPNGQAVPTVVSSIELGKFPRPDYAWIRATERRRAQNATRVVPSGRAGELLSGRPGERAEVRPLHDRVTEPDLFGNETPEEKKARLNKPVDYTKAISAEEMAQRAKQGETRQAVASITGEEPLKTSKDERQIALLEDGPGYGSASLTSQDVRSMGWEIEKRLGLQRFDVHLDERNGDLVLDVIVTPKGERGQGKGSAALKELTDFADREGRRIRVTPAGRGDLDEGTSGKKRLTKFYRRFGFERNVGRSRDLSVDDAMIRDPKTDAIEEGEKGYAKGIRPIGSASMPPKPPVDEPHRGNLFGEEPDDSPIKGFKNAATNLDRDVLGMDERARGEPRTQDEMYDAGKALAAKDPGAMDRLLQELRDNPEKIAGSKEEAGLLLKKRVDLENELKALIDRKDEAVNEDDQPAEQMARLQLQEKRAEIKEFVQLAERTGTATARALAARKMMSALDYSLSHMEAMSEAAKGSPLTDAELAKVKALHDELTEKLVVAARDVAEAKERAAVAEAELHHAKMRLEVAGPLAERITAKLDKASQAAMARIRARGLRASAGMDPEDLADHAIIGAAELAKGAVAFSEWSDTMVRKLGAYVKPHLDEIFQASNTKLDTEISGVTPARPQTHARMKSAADIRARLKARAFDGDTLMELRDYLRRLALEHIRSGITKREPLLDALHKDVEQAVPGISRREVRDALSGYGDFKPLDKSADKTRLREIQAESQKLAQLEALQHGKAPLASGFERQPPSDEARRLTQQVNAAKKAAGITQDREGQLRSALNSAKTRVRNSIKDLQTEIDTGQRIVRGKTSLIGDAELDTLKAQLADLRKTEEQVFGKNTMTDAQRLAMAIRMSKANSDRWAERLQKARTGVFDVKTQTRQSTSPMIDALRAQAKAAKAEYDELKAHDPEQQRIKADTQNMAYRTRLARQEADLLDRIAREDYGPRPVKPGMIPDRQTVEKKAHVEAVKQRYNELNHQWELEQRTPLQKGIDRWTSFVRFGALSWPSVIGKLTSVALTRTITTPITDAVAVGVSHVLPKLAEGAPRYGNSSIRRMIRAEAAAQTAMWVDGLKSSGQLLRNRRSRLELLHGKEKLPPAMKDYMGRLHAALKEPIKEAEYARSLLLRTEQAAMSGEDVTSPVMQLRLSTEAYLDAERAVSMNSNVITDAWNSALRRLEQKEKATGKPSPLGMLLSAAARTEMPVVKAPTNVVLEAGEIIAGLPIGGARAAWAYAHGIEDLTPVERDSILRMIAKGSIGLAIMALYFYKHDTIDFGGFYQPGEKRKPSDIPAGGMRIVGHTVPASLVHNPFFAAGEFAASIARVAPKKLRVHGKEKEGYVNALAAATFGLIDETPILGSLVDEARDIKDPKTRNEFIAKRVSSLAVPGMIQWVAKKVDDDTPRKPKGLVEHLEANIPGLRDRVPTVKQRARQAILQRRMAR